MMPGGHWAAGRFVVLCNYTAGANRLKLNLQQLEDGLQYFRPFRALVSQSLVVSAANWVGRSQPINIDKALKGRHSCSYNGQPNLRTLKG